MFDKQKIMVVDDDHCVTRLLEQMLGHEFELACYPSATEALLCAQEFQPDLILLDHHLPGEDAVHACMQIKRNNHTKDIPVIYLSEDMEIDSVATLASLDVDNFVQMPIKPTVLMDSISPSLPLVAFSEDDEAFSAMM